jgi:hypothetical protein
VLFDVCHNRNLEMQAKSDVDRPLDGERKALSSKCILRCIDWMNG